MFTRLPDTFSCSTEFSELAAILMRENNFRFPTNKEEAEKLSQILLFCVQESYESVFILFDTMSQPVSLSLSERRMVSIKS